MAQRQIINGNWQDAEGNPLALGYLTFRLSTDAHTSGITTNFLIQNPSGRFLLADLSGAIILGTTSSAQVQIAAGRVVFVPLDAFGNISGVVSMWPNDQLIPAGTTYDIIAYTAAGQPVWRIQNFTLPSGAGPYNFGGAPSPSFLLQEDGTFFFELEDGTGVIQLE